MAIVGRPNVGKSTLFNRLAGRRLSIVEDLPGVTRDRLYADAVWEDDDGEDVRYTIIDTGGFEADPETKLFAGIRTQAQIAVQEADVVMMLVDARAGPVPADREVASILRKSGRPVICAANKTDGPKQESYATEFYELGVEEVHPVSASHGIGVGAMLDALFARVDKDLIEQGKEAQRLFEAEDAGLGIEALDEALAEAEDELGLDEDWVDEDDDDIEASDGQDGEEDADEDDDIAARADERAVPIVALPEVLRIAVIGKPNAGKSSFVNKLLGTDRHLVSDLPGTTMDAVDSFLEHGGRNYRFIDTAGIRRKRSIDKQVEKYAVVSALRGLDRCDIAILLIDAIKGMTEQDLKVAAFAHDKGRAIIICVNKWDLAREAGMDAQEVALKIRDRAAFLSYAPIRFISAKTGRRVFDVLDTCADVAEQFFTRVPTSAVNRCVETAIRAHAPPVRAGRRVKIYFGTQVRTAPPTFVLATNDVDGVHFSYQRFLQNQFRDTFGFEGTPIRIFLRPRGSAEGRKKNMEARKRRKKIVGKVKGGHKAKIQQKNKKLKRHGRA